MNPNNGSMQQDIMINTLNWYLGKSFIKIITYHNYINYHFIIFPLQLDNKGFTFVNISLEEFQLPLKNIWFPNGGKLHLKAAVTERASGQVQKATDVSVVFSDHLHTIKFSRSSRYFKPGLVYVLEVSN